MPEQNSSFFSRRKSQAIVELALSLPVFLFLFITIVDGARMMNLYCNLSRLANQGASYAVGLNSNLSRPTANQVKQYLLTRALPPMNISKLKESSAIAVKDDIIDSLGLVSTQVEIKYTLPLTSPFLGPIFGRHYKLTVRALFPHQEN